MYRGHNLIKGAHKEITNIKKRYTLKKNIHGDKTNTKKVYIRSRDKSRGETYG